MRSISIAECVAAASVVLVFIGCDDERGAGSSVVYFCTETQEAFVGTPQPTPLANPDTGRKTLVPALYNPEAGRWQAMPPLELLDGNAGAAISKDADQPLTPDGPTAGLRRLDAVESGRP